MAVYAIGDVQGCYDALQKLLKQLKFNIDKDKLWFAGDLVNRGDKSLKTLRFIRSLGKSAICVLGNHDITLIAMHYGLFKTNNCTKKILQANDREELIHWLRNLPLLHVDNSLGYCMVHAGIPPVWNLKQAQKQAREVEKKLKNKHTAEWLKKMYHNRPTYWSENLKKRDKQRYTLNVLTRMRYCFSDGSLEFKHKKYPSLSSEIMPWFSCDNRQKLGLKLLFGHWSDLGYYQNDQVISLDTACVWGGRLTAVRIDTPKISVIQTKCKKYGS